MMDRGFLAIIIAGSLGGAAAVGLMEAALAYSAFPLSYIPFATSIVVVMGSPEAPPAQPRALIGGHVISTIIGLLVVKAVGPGPWTAALAVGLSIIAMRLMRTFHPPAGIDPLIVVTHDFSWEFLLVPVAVGACTARAVRVCLASDRAMAAWPLNSQEAAALSAASRIR